MASLPPDMGHHIRALPPALTAMQALGYSAADCLAGTGLREQDLAAADTAPAFSLEQEFRFHRNLLALTGDPVLGLTLGRAYRIESYGLLGYAFLSAPTLRHAMTIVRNYGPLSFTLFDIDFRVEGAVASLRFAPGRYIPDDLLTFYVDRDLTAAVYGSNSALPEAIEPRSVRLMHGEGGRRDRYERHFGCPVAFDCAVSELRINAAGLDAPMPLRDAQTSALCQQQCRLLLARMSQSGGFVEQVRQLIVSRPGYFPDADYVAEKLGMNTRTLRRRLARENSSYREILDELRYQLAREYLGTSSLPVEEIAAMLGYSNPGNFTNAFKRWHGLPPSEYRQSLR